MAIANSDPVRAWLRFLEEWKMTPGEVNGSARHLWESTGTAILLAYSALDGEAAESAARFATDQLRLPLLGSLRGRLAERDREEAILLAMEHPSDFLEGHRSFSARNTGTAQIVRLSSKHGADAIPKRRSTGSFRSKQTMISEPTSEASSPARSTFPTLG
ncbi:MAG: hypothetical protein O3C21_10715 [Verrucomicrobia bacterium]|nr:hypothetical protein [Verrucomicrobiota bacterium]